MNDPKSKLSRRHVFAGAGAVGALAATAALLPGTEATQGAGASAKFAAKDEAGGYRLTAHIQRYYQTAKV